MPPKIFSAVEKGQHACHISRRGLEGVTVIIMINFALPLSEERRERSRPFRQHAVCHLTVTFGLTSVLTAFCSHGGFVCGQCKSCTKSSGRPSAENPSQILHGGFSGEEFNLSEHLHGHFVWTFLFLHSLLPALVHPYKALDQDFLWQRLWRSPMETRALLTINLLC